jgi:hypothetical protein
MASSKLKREYPYLAAYLDHEIASPSVAASEKIMGMGCVGLGLGAPLAGLLAAIGVSVATGNFGFGILGGAVAFVAALGLGGAILAKKVKASQQPASEEDRLLREAMGSRSALLDLDKNKKLTKWLDPVAAQLLEAGAYHWSRVRTTLDASAWTHGDVPGHWKALRERALTGADVAMAELLILASGCVGEPMKNRKDEWNSIVEDFVSLDIEDALRGLSKATSNHPNQYRYTSPNTRDIFDPGKRIAERLKDLADEVQNATPRVLAETSNTIAIPGATTGYATESLDVLLGEIKAVRQAEKELHEEQQT